MAGAAGIVATVSGVDKQATDNTLVGHIGEFLAVQLGRAKSGRIEVRTYKSYLERGEFFRKWLREASRNEIAARVATAYRSHLLGRIAKAEMSEQYGASPFSQARVVEQ